MMRSAPRLLMTVAVLAAATTAVITCSRAAHAGSGAARAVARFDALRLQAKELNELRSGSRVGAKSAESRGPKLASVAAEVIAAGGLPAGALSSLSPESETIERTGADAPISRRRATLTLTPLTLPQLGRVLDLWRQRLPSWTIARIDLEPRRDANTAPYLAQGKLYEAASEFEWARKLMPGNPDPRMNLALTLESAGRTDEALKVYQTALDVQPEHLATIQALTRLQVRSGKTDDHTRERLEAIAMRGDQTWRDWAVLTKTRLDRGGTAE